MHVRSYCEAQPKRNLPPILFNTRQLHKTSHFRASPRRSKNVTTIAEELKLEQSSVSHNLMKLERCNFVFAERKIKERFYTLNKETMEPVFKTFDFHAKKYCPAKGRCLTEKGLREHRKKNASNRAYVTHE